MNFYFGRMVDVITRYRGTVIEFLGDGVLAVFGAPILSDNHIADAIAAAIQMQNEMDTVNAFCKAQEYPLLEMGIGIHSGEAFIGNVGSEKMMRYNVIGKVVNECSRIESYSVGGQVLVSEEAIQQVSVPVEIHNRTEITVKGIHKPVSVCEVTALGGEYGCAIENVKFDEVVPVKERMVVRLYRIEDKMVTGKAVFAVLEQFSLKRAVVSFEDPEQEDNRQLAIYSDVEMAAVREDGHTIFDGVYAKVVDVKQNRLVLHFTHVNHDLQRFAKDVVPQLTED